MLSQSKATNLIFLDSNTILLYTYTNSFAKKIGYLLIVLKVFFSKEDGMENLLLFIVEFVKDTVFAQFSAIKCLIYTQIEVLVCDSLDTL